MTVPAYDEQVVNSYLLAVQRNSYVISDNDSDYDIWLSYLEIQEIYDYNSFKNVDAGIAIIRIHYVNAKNCKPCECIPELLLEFAFGGDYFIQDIHNYKKEVKPNVCC